MGVGREEKREEEHEEGREGSEKQVNAGASLRVRGDIANREGNYAVAPAF